MSTSNGSVSLSPADAASVSDARVQWLFPSPVLVHDWPADESLNEALRQAVRQRRTTTEGVVKTNRGGWQSDTDLQDWGDPATQMLVQRITRLAREYAVRQAGRDDPAFASDWKIRAWANVNGHGHFNRTHDHLGRYSFSRASTTSMSVTSSRARWPEAVPDSRTGPAWPSTPTRMPIRCGATCSCRRATAAW